MQKIQNNLKALLTVLVLIVLFTGCISTRNTSKVLYASLDSATTLYNATYEVLEDLNAKGTLKEEDKPKIKALMVKAEMALKTSTNTLKIYVEHSTEENKISFETSLIVLNNLIIDICKFIGED